MTRFAYDFERPLVELEERLDELRAKHSADQPDISAEIAYLESEIEKIRLRVYSDLGPWERVQLSRHPDRPKASDYISQIFTGLVELHGDRLFGDDPAVMAALGMLGAVKVAVLGTRKGKTTKENLKRNFGMAHPEGFRKARRIMRLAGRFGLPIVFFVDTQGAYPGIGAEERGQAWAISENLVELGELPVPVIVVNVGEAGSGGALAMGFGDALLMLENAYYSVITPEGCASILWRDASKAPIAADALCLTADRLFELGIVDEVIPEVLGGANRDPAKTIFSVREALIRHLGLLCQRSGNELVASRYQRLRKLGEFLE
ncbi:MAG: acetyl-CoA carboxylase carboxyltransferase subunit alpha [Actinobacteria bacterium]|nr:MAG: acetyl-CoA carboxylase carboxyltransferase subunit alpha [Actinomycetota bacterium]